MHAAKIQVGEVYLVRHNKGKDYDFGTTVPAYEGPGLVLEVSWVHGAFSGKKRKDGTIPEQQRRRGVVRYMAQTGEERIVGAEAIKEELGDNRTGNALRRLWEKQGGNNRLVAPLVTSDSKVAKLADLNGNNTSAYDARRVLELLRKKEDALEQKLNAARAECEGLENEHDTICAAIATLTNALKEIASAQA